MSGMGEVIFGPPVSAVNVDDQRKGCFGLRQTKVEKLILIGAIVHARISRRRRQRENRIRHNDLRIRTYSYRSASIGSRFAARIAGTIPLITPTKTRITVDTSRIIGETISRMS